MLGDGVPEALGIVAARFQRSGSVMRHLMTPCCSYSTRAPGG